VTRIAEATTSLDRVAVSNIIEVRAVGEELTTDSILIVAPGNTKIDTSITKKIIEHFTKEPQFDDQLK
jgi:hypothetical protein